MTSNNINIDFGTLGWSAVGLVSIAGSTGNLQSYMSRLDFESTTPKLEEKLAGYIGENSNNPIESAIYSGLYSAGVSIDSAMKLVGDLPHARTNWTYDKDDPSVRFSTKLGELTSLEEFQEEAVEAKDSEIISNDEYSQISKISGQSGVFKIDKETVEDFIEITQSFEGNLDGIEQKAYQDLLQMMETEEQRS